MKQVVATVTKAGQVTLPAEVRRILGVKARDRVAFTIDDGRVSVVPVRFTVRSVAASVGPPTSTQELDRRIEEANEEMAAKAVSSLTGG